MVFKIKDLSNKKHLWKIDINANQFQLTGVCVLCPGIGNLLVVEGGARAIKRYKKLLLRRMKWTETAGNEEDHDNGDMVDGHDICVLMWEGSQQFRKFKTFKAHTTRSEAEARRILSEKACEHFWTMLATYRDAAVDL